MPMKPGIGLYLKVLSEALQQYGNAQLQDRDLTFSQSKLLMVLGDRPDHAASMKELQEAYRGAQSTVCGIVSRMEKKGLVEAVACPGDRRVKRIRLTEAGVAMRQDCISDMRESERWLTLSLNGEECELLSRFLSRMCEGRWRIVVPQSPSDDSDNG